MRLHVLLLIALPSHASASECNPWCANPCEDLAGNTDKECGGCSGSEDFAHYKCKPGQRVQVSELGATSVPLASKTLGTVPIATSELSTRHYIHVNESALLSSREELPCQVLPYLHLPTAPLHCARAPTPHIRALPVPASDGCRAHDPLDS